MRKRQPAKKRHEANLDLSFLDHSHLRLSEVPVEASVEVAAPTLKAGAMVTPARPKTAIDRERFSRCKFCKSVFARTVIEKHMVERHREEYFQEMLKGAALSQERKQTDLSKYHPRCSFCGQSDGHPHLSNCRAGKIQQQIPNHFLSTQFLPSGSGIWQRVYDHCAHVKKHRPCATFQQERLDFVRSLNPDRSYESLSRLTDYLVFEFDRSTHVLAENFFDLNAAYVLRRENWREAIRMSKAELLNDPTVLHSRIVHVDNWKMRLKIAIEAA